ncbi:MAG: SAM-dependent chlorinase/fluorinase [Roseofilum sp. Belize Diploria]|nr:SAM-dependent chlorinase/fluorinase [Roseofilum sp. Belize Diploria]
MGVPRILTLLTDFGLQDPYVGVMKGAIAQINPQIAAIDLTHDLPRQNLVAARFALMNAYPYFPDDTVHVAVVDPGVGGDRRAIALELAQGFLVGPDNGIFSGILSQYPLIKAVELTNDNYWRSPNPSTTFHGRDIFAPVGAHLANGVPIEQLGEAIDPHTLVNLSLPSYTQEKPYIRGAIQSIDHFGNLITNIPGEAVNDVPWSVILNEEIIIGAQTYSDLPIGQAIALIGSHGWVEIAVNCGNAEKELRLTWGDPVQLLIYTE